MQARLHKHYTEIVRPKLMTQFSYKNQMQVPRLDKIVINMGVGEATQDSKKVDLALEELARIAGQRPVKTRARSRSRSSRSARISRSAARSRCAATGCTSSSTG